MEKWKQKLKTKLLSLNFLLVVNNDKNSDQEKILFGNGILKLGKISLAWKPFECQNTDGLDVSLFRLLSLVKVLNWFQQPDEFFWRNYVLNLDSDL